MPYHQRQHELTIICCREFLLLFQNTSSKLCYMSFILVYPSRSFQNESYFWWPGLDKAVDGLRTLFQPALPVKLLDKLQLLHHSIPGFGPQNLGKEFTSTSPVHSKGNRISFSSTPSSLWRFNEMSSCLPQLP